MELVSVNNSHVQIRNCLMMIDFLDPRYYTSNYHNIEGVQKIYTLAQNSTAEVFNNIYIDTYDTTKINENRPHEQIYNQKYNPNTYTFNGNNITLINKNNINVNLTSYTGQKFYKSSWNYKEISYQENTEIDLNELEKINKIFSSLEDIRNDVYEVQLGSPTINAGHPDYSDPDGTVSDIGPFYFDLTPKLEILADGEKVTG